MSYWEISKQLNQNGYQKRNGCRFRLEVVVLILSRDKPDSNPCYLAIKIERYLL